MRPFSPSKYKHTSKPECILIRFLKPQLLYLAIWAQRQQASGHNSIMRRNPLLSCAASHTFKGSEPIFHVSVMQSCRDGEKNNGAITDLAS